MAATATDETEERSYARSRGAVRGFFWGLFAISISGKHNDEVQLCAFNVLAMNGDDLRALPLSLRKTNLTQLLAVTRWDLSQRL